MLSVEKVIQRYFLLLDNRELRGLPDAIIHDHDFSILDNTGEVSQTGNWKDITYLISHVLQPA